ncbi:hypothetical protein APR11_004401 [Nocardia amikacinitolerans]|nr:hypothetical protein [Nocardia amikacinitolerans]MCP2280945.1 hypothetical protein [Nocardia amikacinitolerans]MCP2297960.1 hypothetical protein [Nocardia amikacinitolerans]
MSPYSWSPPGGRYLSFAEREEIALLKAHHTSRDRQDGTSGKNVDLVTGGPAVNTNQPN